MPDSWTHVKENELKSISGVCLDIDDTLSTSGKLTSEAFAALWQLKKAGFVVVPITGRPAGWCDHIARFWPVDAVVGENGAFVFYMQNGIRKRLNTLKPSLEKSLKVRLNLLAKKIKKKFPNAKWASDQSYREYDLAVDICEDVKPWSPSKVQDLLKFCNDAGAHAKLSSIHVNIWFGEYDKNKGFSNWISRGAPGLSLGTELKPTIKKNDFWIFIGDSPNDEPMFRRFNYSVGVANLSNYLEKMTHLPKWITQGESGKGFVEMAEQLVRSRG